MRELDLTGGEAIEFAKLNAGVVQPSRTGINPYYLGIKMFEDIGQLGIHSLIKRSKGDIDKIYEMLSHFMSQNDINITQLESKNKPKELSSTFFSEIEEGHYPSPPDRLE